MSTAADVIKRLSHTSLINANLKYCLVDSNKHPYKLDNTPARSNCIDDFVTFDILSESSLTHHYAGVGISIQASDVCAIDVDHCFSIANDISSGDERAMYCLEQFKDIAYCEFSFSGTGLRIIFKYHIIDNYSDIYYIKNEKYKIEFYQPNHSSRYVTLTGNYIFNNDIVNIDNNSHIVDAFLNKYMKRQKKLYAVYTTYTETKTYEELMNIVKTHYRRNILFQNLWFDKAPGSGKNESERDYHLVAYLYDFITQDKDMIQKLFESSEFFKTKDHKHVYKWTNNNHRYFNYLYNTIRRSKL